MGDLGSIPGLGASLEKEMATHSSILAWRIPWTEKPGGLQSVGLQRVGHNRVTSLSSKFQVYNTLWLTIVTLMYIRAPECIYPGYLKLCTLDQYFPIPLTSQPVNNYKMIFLRQIWVCKYGIS